MAKEGYSVKELADMSGVSVRTLHHYDALGLLCPVRRPNGYRSYFKEDAGRLQQILLFRACGMELREIQDLLEAPDYDARAALSAQLDRLQDQKRELKRLIAATRKTIWSLEEGWDMDDRERFEGLKREAVDANEERFGAEARALHGDAAVDAANERLLTMDAREWSDMETLEAAIFDQLKAAMAQGDPAGPAARELAAMHARWIEMHWAKGAYSAEAHLALGRAYLADARFTEYYDSRAGAGATEFLVSALERCLS